MSLFRALVRAVPGVPRSKRHAAHDNGPRIVPRDELYAKASACSVRVCAVHMILERR